MGGEERGEGEGEMASEKERWQVRSGRRRDMRKARREREKGEWEKEGRKERASE